MDLGFNDPAVLDQLSRKELQGLAKRHKIKANAKVEAGAAHPNPVVPPSMPGCQYNCNFGVLA